MTYREAIAKRRSIRNYDKAKLEDALINKIEKIISDPTTGPFGNKPRFVLIEKPKAREEANVKLGTYGFISNAAYFIGGAVEKFEFSEVDYGYSLERIVIDLTRMDLGTCWIGGTFKRKEYELLLKTRESETIPCITPVGFPAKNRSLRERLGLKLTDGSKRKNFDTLFFDQSLDKPLIYDPHNNYHLALEAVRLAPSAVNKQPWRVIREDNKYHFYIARDKFVGKSKNTDLQKVDMGIALAHFKMTLEELFTKGKWHITNPEICDLEYLITWVE